MPNNQKKSVAPWIPLSTSFSFLLGNRVLFGWSLMLVLITIILTWLGYELTTGMLDSLTSTYFASAPASESWWGWLKMAGWLAAKYLFLLVSRIVAFFLAFLLAYSLSTPFYVFLSTAAERIFCGAGFAADEPVTLLSILKDLLEGFKIAAFGILITIIALPASFIPVVGQIAVLVIYTFYSALMFIDYPASRRHWSLGRKLSWIRKHYRVSLRLGIMPAAISMIPVLNLFLIAFAFPLLTVHATLNFTNMEQPPSPPAGRASG
ncbi:MAG: EI24 domain-containing protein [Desulfofustis sp.]|nr:EI24 domain-containing protein [Desulfofustis sp.]